MNVISEKEYSFSNALFWNVMLHHHIQAFDEERDVNFDEVWDEELAPALLDEIEENAALILPAIFAGPTTPLQKLYLPEN